MFDQAMLIRELRRLRNIGGIMGGATAIALWLFIAWPLLVGSSEGDETTRAAWAVGAAGVLGCLIAFASAAAVIRREASGHTLESLLVTNQQSRPVVTSIVLVAALRGGIVVLLTLLTLFFTHEPTVHHAAGLLAAFVLIGVCLFIAAGVGVVLSMPQMAGLMSSRAVPLTMIITFAVFAVDLIRRASGPSSLITVFFVNAPVAVALYPIIWERLLTTYGVGDRRISINPSARWPLIAFCLIMSRLLLVIVMGDIDWRFTGAVMGSAKWLVLANPMVVAARLGGEWQKLANQNQVPAMVFLTVHGMIVAAGVICWAARMYRQLRWDAKEARLPADNGKTPDVDKPDGPWRCGRNPVLSREFRWWRPKIEFTAVLVALVALSALTRVSQNRWDPEVAALLVICAGILFPAALAIFADSRRPVSLGQERESGMVESLLCTRLTPNEILVGKFVGALAPMAISAAPALSVILIASLFGCVPLALGLAACCLTLTYSLSLSALFVAVPVLAARASFRPYLLIGAAVIYGVAWGFPATTWTGPDVMGPQPEVGIVWLAAGPVLLTGLSGVLWLIAARRLRSGGAL